MIEFGGCNDDDDVFDDLFRFIIIYLSVATILFFLVALIFVKQIKITIFAA